jgi:5'(3')-deoxyribonucleotidase
LRTSDQQYTSSSGEECDDDDTVDYSNIFKGLDKSKVDKINELIDALNEKDRLLEKQEDLLYEEHDKVVKVEKSLALEIKKNEMLAYKLSSFHSSITSLKSLNDNLNARIDKVNVASSSIEHVLICANCKDHDLNVCSIMLLLQQN